MADRQHSEHNCVDQAEYSGIGADAKRESEDGGDGKTGVPPQHPESVSEIAAEFFENSFAGHHIYFSRIRLTCGPAYSRLAVMEIELDHLVRLHRSGLSRSRGARSLRFA